ncbi:hypothetical protein HMPREF0497_2901 [Lentilactobacillus buchneri ATCC 11577]|nr:hypothetical protein HMPREF0497_2901 [Lentilactobacillus buchneri ATCC 11577]
MTAENQATRLSHYKMKILLDSKKTPPKLMSSAFLDMQLA